MPKQALTRRQLVGGFGIFTVAFLIGCGNAWPSATRPARPRRVAFIGEAVPQPWLEKFQQGLREAGYHEGGDVDVRYMMVDGPEQYPEVATQAVRDGVDLIVSVGTSATLASRGASNVIPIVAVQVTDLVENGLAISAAHPGSNVTGLTTLSDELAAKRLELLRELVPGLKRVAVFWNVENSGIARQLTQLQVAAGALGFEVLPLGVHGVEDLDGVFATAIGQGAEGVVVLPSPPMSVSDQARLVDFASQARLPAVYPYPSYATDLGGLASLGPNYPAMFRRAAAYVDKILKGTPPGDLPIERPTVFELILNMGAARTLGLSVPQSVMLETTQILP